MKSIRSHSKTLFVFTIFSFLVACKNVEIVNPIVRGHSSTTPSFLPDIASDAQISEYIRNIYEDKNGGLWFGTNGDGVAHYDGHTLSYYSNAQGFHGQQITGIAEDLAQNIWFATDQGIVKYDGSVDHKGQKRFINYKGLLDIGGKRFWSVFADRKGMIWAGSEANIYQFDGVQWKPFELPYPEKITGEFITKATTWSITEDRAGNIWFSTNGFGAFKYNGTTFTRYSQEDGLTDDSVDNIVEDRNGNIWFGTRYGGVSQYNGSIFTNYTSKDSIGDNEVCIIYEDTSGHIWMSSEGYGVYRYDGRSFTNYGEAQGLNVKAVQAIFEDRKGRFWVGGGGGLYRFERDSFINVTKNGPWY